MNNKFTFAAAIIVIGLSFFSCTSESTLIVSGEIAGGEQDTLLVSHELSNETFKVAVDASGKFATEIPGAPGYYQIRSKSKLLQPGFQVYLKKDEAVQFNIETENWPREQNYTVLNSPESVYLHRFFKDTRAFYKKFRYNLRGLEVTRFMEVIDSFNVEQGRYLDEVLAENKGITADFKGTERARILYNYAEMKESYALRRKPSALPDNFFDFRKQLNYNDETLLALSGADYAVAVSRFITNETARTLTDDDDPIFHMINTCVNNISNQKVLNYLLRSMVEPYLQTSGKYEAAYQLFIAHCNDPETVKKVQEKFEIYQKTTPGKPSPKFVDYENRAGELVSLDNFKGKYVYIDVWATWCTPCRKEIPALKALEKKFRGANIQFVSISIDDSKNKALWQQTVDEEQLTGTQLLASQSVNSSFMQDYAITSIPRFIFIDPEGKVINANAPKPSDPAMEALLNEYLGK